MRIARFSVDDEPKYGVVETDDPEGVVGTVSVLDSDPLYRPVQFTGEKLQLADVRLLAPVIPRKERVNEVIFGYTVANDVTARDLQKTDGQWARAKGFDTFCPLGPWITTELDVSDVRVTTELNGEPKQDGRTSQFIFDIPEVLAYITSFTTLLPGDVVLTGTPAGVGPMLPGDEVSVSVEGIGTLTNKVIVRD